ncbi:MAG: NAD-dependent protein deacylase [Propionibacteriaceae bacterium]|jgi:NAD-dependent deacetylase|nr:NAD-dependent protein deacylase [Propionibacteriaceae bacterium]
MAETLREIVDGSRRIVFFGGAGVSTESGIPDFRSADGVYNQQLGATLSPEQMTSHSFLVEHPEDFFEFYKRHLVHPQARPNKAHLALAALERAGKLSAVVTQNIDGLHQMAGSQRVLELHGSVHRNHCVQCHKSFGLDYVLGAVGVPECDECGGVVRPDVVLFEEMLDGRVMEEAVEEIAAADTLIVGGTSLVVYPAAGLAQAFRGENLVVINMGETGMDRRATLTIRQPIGEALAPFAQ